MPALTFQPLSLRYSDPLSHSSTVSLEPHVSCSDSAHCGSTASSENGGGSVIAAGGGGGDDDDDGVVDVADVDGKSVIIVNRNNPTRLAADVCVCPRLSLWVCWSALATRFFASSRHERTGSA